MYFVYLKHNIIMPASRATILNYACVLVKCDVKTGAYYGAIRLVTATLE